MLQQEMLDQYKLWCEKAEGDPDMLQELKAMEKNPEQIEDAFYKELGFGTGGIRGIMGAGTNRINSYIVARATRGVASYLKKRFSEAKVAVGYDSRFFSREFAGKTAQVLASEGIYVHLFPALMPTPCLSFAVRRLQCKAGIMITASHNPAEYNGYKVYGPDGCQITTQAAAAISAEIKSHPVFEDQQEMEFEEAVRAGFITYIGKEVEDAFIEEVKAQSPLGSEDKINRDISIVYTPLNGTGLKPVTRALAESGFTRIHVVKEQENPDGAFPTCPYPNPEEKEAMSLGMEYAKKLQADLLLATDPDCDRVGIAIKRPDGTYMLLSANETGVLLLDYICARKKEQGTMPSDPVFVKTIVTTDLAERIASRYGVKTVNVLTGFKYIGEYIGTLEAMGKEESYVFGFEESYGFLSGTYVRDKDAVNASYLICEMFAYYKTRGMGLYEKLQELYREYGYCLNTQHSYTFKGSQGTEKMKQIMELLRGGLASLGRMQVAGTLDYAKGIEGLPKSDVMKFALEDGSSIVVRPSGTEPKLKIYVSVSAKEKELLKEKEQQLADAVKQLIQGS